MANGYWVIRTYTAGAGGEKIKYWVPGEKPTKSERKIKSDIKQVQRNEANAEKALARLIHANFTPRDYLLQFSYTEEALEKLSENPDVRVTLLDIMLPGTDGFALCRAAREQGDAPVLFVTAREDEQDKLYGYDQGADDYVVKPFSLAVLYAKAQALLRRSRGMTAAEVLRAGALELNPARGTVTADGQRIDLPPKEFALLRAGWYRTAATGAPTRISSFILT